MNIPTQTRITLHSFTIVFVDFQSDSTNKDLTREADLSLGINVEKSTDSSFSVIFNVSLNNQANGFKLSLKAKAIFTTTDLIDNQFLESHFAKVNAPAIAFPFVRSYIANFTINSGYNPIMLPAFNFQAMNKLAEVE